MRQDRVIRERATLQADVAGLTLTDLFADTVASHPDRAAVAWRARGTWQVATWGTYWEHASRAALGLVAAGIRPGDTVILHLGNRPEHLFGDLGVLLAAGVPVPLPPGTAPHALAAIAGRCRATVVISEHAEVWAGLRARLPALRSVVAVGGDGSGWSDLLATGRDMLRAGGQAELEDRRDAVATTDPVVLVHPPGGQPGGVRVSHRNVLWQLASLHRILDLPRQRRVVSFRPLAGLDERLFSHYASIRDAACVYLCRQPVDGLPTLQEVGPELVALPPGLWASVQAGLAAAVSSTQPRRRRRRVEQALGVGLEVARLQREGEPLPLALGLRRALSDRLLVAPLRRGAGLGACRTAIALGGPLDAAVREGLAAAGVEVLASYGTARTTVVATIERPGMVRPGTVGVPIPGCEVRVSEDGAIVARGPNVTGTGDAAHAADGWLVTGDTGSVEGDYLRVTDHRDHTSGVTIVVDGDELDPAPVRLPQHGPYYRAGRPS